MTPEEKELRDRIAIEAMSALVGNPHNKASASEFAKLAYDLADAMLEARK